MLISCPECNHDVSYKAAFCPQCGYPFQTSPKRPRTRRRRRLPNGFGQISKITNQNLRKPYRAMVTIGKNETGKPICKLLEPQAYFETYNEAYEALLEYNKTPHEKLADTTVANVFEQWLARQIDEYPGTEYKHRNSWKHIQYLEDTRISEIRTKDIKESIEGKDLTPITKSGIKILWNKLFDYALEYDMVEANYARRYTIPKSEQYKKPKDAHKALSDEELNILWQHTDDPAVKLILFQCYTGFRPSEMLDIKVANISNRFITGGSKTDAGKNRKVPIHPKISGFIQDFKRDESKYLFTIISR